MKIKPGSRALLVATLFFVASNAWAVVGVRRVTTYWGYYLSNGGTVCSVLLGPPLPPEIIGQRIRECDGTTWSWGNTSCTDYAPTTEYEPCDGVSASDGDFEGVAQGNTQPVSTGVEDSQKNNCVP